MGTSDFAFVYVESKSEVNGASSIYVVTVTLGVDTPQSGFLMVFWPDEIELDSTRLIVCMGTTNLQQSVGCLSATPNYRAIPLRSDDLFDTSNH
jgi:hypothetical protein